MPLSLLSSHVQKQGAIARPFEGYIFLCGGPLEAGGESLASARQFVMERVDANAGRLAGHRVILAEKATDLLEGPDFSDLLEFENYLAALASCIVVFVESPGSIAELGCFSVMEHISQKLLVIYEQSFADGAASFISHGPIKSLKKSRNESVLAFPYTDYSQCPAAAHRPYLDDCWDEILSAVSDATRSPVSEAPLDVEKLPHQLLLISDLVDLLVALRLRELLEVLRHFGVTIGQGDLARGLRLLQRFELLTTRTYGHEVFYVSLDHEPRITYRSTRASQIFDRGRFQYLAVDFYRTNDVRKAKMLKALAREAEAA